MRLVYCTDSICYLGGIQRITIAKASALANIPGNEVWIVVTDNCKDIVLPINPDVHIINLNVNYFEDDWKGKLYVLKGILYKRIIHKKRLTAALEQIQPDIVIATGTSEKNFLPSIHISSKPIFVREIHNYKYYRRAAANNWFSKLLAIGGDFIDYKLHIHKYDRIVVLTEEDKLTNWRGNPRVCSIPNPLTIKSAQKSSYQNKTVIAAGRLTYQKNFASLISIWKSIHSSHPDWKLEIWGSGGCQGQLTMLIDKLNLRNSVFLKGYSPDVISRMAEASLFALTSTFEGWGLVIVEAMSVGLPVVAYQCPCGPKDIISDNEDGYLIPLGDENLFAKRLSVLMDDVNLRITMGNSAIQKSETYYIENVTKKWMELFTQIRYDKQ